MGGSAGAPFLNLVVVGFSRSSPEALLAYGKALECAAGRRRGPRWGPRTLDIDLLFCGDLVRHRPELTLPHPGIRARAFVRVPLAEIDRQAGLDAVRCEGAESLTCRGPLSY